MQKFRKKNGESAPVDAIWQDRDVLFDLDIR